MDLILASKSSSRIRMLQAAGVPFTTMAANVDETAIIESMRERNAVPRDMADALAELKALKISSAHPHALVLGCDQILECGGTFFETAKTSAEAHTTLIRLRGKKHTLVSAAVLSIGGSAIWRHVDSAEMVMRDFSDDFLDTYLAEAGSILTQSVGAYALEGFGIQLFSAVRGDAFTIQGLPLMAVLDALRTQGILIR